MMTALLVGVFGVAGALLRFAVDSFFAHHQGTRPHWPWATLAVNVAGSFIIGLSVGLTGHLELGADWHAGVATGLAGGLTTFSSWSTATVRLVSEDAVPGCGAQHRLKSRRGPRRRGPRTIPRRLRTPARHRCVEPYTGPLQWLRAAVVPVSLKDGYPT